ncbi:MAG: DUF4878 domain-containing protein [Bacteroidales bacterium]|jgi:hypothetical protein|nr:DUF4878 domain-containing protein [Bacteroidales bacterium]
MKKIASLIMALCVISLVSCSSGSKGKTPSDTAKNYLTSLQSGKYEKALSYYDLPEAMEMQALIGKLEESEKKKDGLKSFKLVEGGEKISEDGLTATVAVIMTHGNGDVEEETLHLKKVDDEWKLDINLGSK